MSYTRTALCLLGLAILAVCEAQAVNEAALADLKDGRARWFKLKADLGIADYQYRLYRPCTEECEMQFPDCFLGDHGPFYITVKDGAVSEALLMWSDTPLDTTRFKTIEKIFDDLESQISSGVSVDPFWRFDDVQGVPDDVVTRPNGEGYATRIVVRLPVGFHLGRLAASRAAFAAMNVKDYSFTFRRLCFGCDPTKTMEVRNGAAVDGGMTMEDVFDLMQMVIESDPLFLDIFYGLDGLPTGMDVDVDNLIVSGDTDDTIRIGKFTKL